MIHYLFLISEKIARIISSIFVIGYLASYLGLNSFGEYSISLTIFSIFSAIVIGGSDTVLLKGIASGNKVRVSSMVWGAILYRLCILFVLLFSIFLLYELNSEFQRVIESKFVLFFILAYSIFNIFEVFLQSILSTKVIALVHVSIIVVFSILRVLFVQLDLNLNDFILLYSIEMLLLGFVFTLIVRINHHYVFDFRKRYVFLSFKKIVRDSLPILCASIVITVYTRVDQVMLGYMSNLNEVGLYAAAFRLTDPFSFFVVVLSTLFVRKIAITKNKNSKKQVSKQFIECVLLIGICIVCGYLIFSDFIVDIVYGQEFLSASLICEILSFSLLLNFIGVALMKLSVVENVHHSITVRVLLGAVFNFCFNFLLIPEYGAVGAAISSVIAQLIASVIGFYSKSTKHLLYLLLSSFKFKELRTNYRKVLDFG